MQCFAAWVCSCNGRLSNTNPLEQLVQTPCLVQLVQPLDWTYAKQVWSWIRRETWSVAIHECKLVLLWGTLRVSIFHCLRHVLVSICLWFCGLDSGMTGTMPTFWHYKVLTISSFFVACSQQSSMASLSSRSSVRYAEGLQPFCQIVLAVHLRPATLLQSLIMSMCHMRTDPRLVWLPLLPPWHEPLPKSARVRGFPS